MSPCAKTLCGLCGLLVLAAATPTLRASTLLYDFEDDTEGWQHEAARPQPLFQAVEAHHGAQAMGITFRFSPDTPTLQVRVKKHFPRDFSALPGFKGLSAWVFLPKRRKWEVLLFVRSGDEWMWTTGPTVKPRKKGWVRVEIGKDDIFDITKVQDLGIQVTYKDSRPLEATIHIDQVEAITP